MTNQDNNIIEPLVDLITRDAIEIFNTQGEKACRNVLQFLGLTDRGIEATINDLKEKQK